MGYFSVGYHLTIFSKVTSSPRKYFLRMSPFQRWMLPKKFIFLKLIFIESESTPRIFLKREPFPRWSSFSEQVFSKKVFHLNFSPVGVSRGTKSRLMLCLFPELAFRAISYLHKTVIPRRRYFLTINLF